MDSLTVMVEFDHIEGLARRLLANVSMHKVGSILVKCKCVGEGLGGRLEAEGNGRVADGMSERIYEKNMF